jgi:hypothetical protein
MKNFQRLLLVLIFCFLTACDFTLNNLKFDADKWKNADLRTRGRMLKDLKNSKILEGKTKSEVEELLGRPNSNIPNNWVYKIDLGHKFGSHAWTYNLNVEFHTEAETVKRIYEND